MQVEDIQILSKQRRIKWSAHCLERMQERDIGREDVNFPILQNLKLI